MLHSSVWGILVVPHGHAIAFVILSHTVLHARTCLRTSHHLCSSDSHYNCKVCEWKPVLKIPSGHTAILSGLVVAAVGIYNKCCQKEPVDTPSGERRSSYNIVRALASQLLLQERDRAFQSRWTLHSGLRLRLIRQ